MFLTVVFTYAAPVFADWQTTLENNFDHVETFDNLADFTGTSTGDVFSGSMPVKLDGGETNWDYYSLWSTIDYSKKWIGNQGPSNNWSGKKAMAIDYGGSDGGNGPSRFGYYIGGGDPSAGYADIYVFYMVKVPSQFYPMTGDKFDYFAYLKTFEIASGFRDVWNWGSTYEQTLTDGTDQVDHVYGLNFAMFNHSDCNYSPCTDNSYGDDMATLIHPIPAGKAYPYHYSGVYGSDGYMFREATLGSSVRKSEWYGVEYRVKQSQPHGSTNGLMEVWIYDSSGNIAGHQSHTVTTFRDISVPLNHGYNKFVIGGNRSGFDKATGGTLYVDDFLISGSRIGIKYFELLSGSNSPNPPDPSPGAMEKPSNLRTISQGS